MTEEKFIAFLDKLLRKTKFGEIVWKRHSPHPAYYSWGSNLKSFQCKAGTMSVRMIADDDYERICFDISYDMDLPSVSIEPSSDEAKQIALRLATYVYDQFPNLEKSIDQFLRDF